MNRIIEKFDTLTESERRVCNYIVQNMHEVETININELADKSLTSKTVVITMSQKLGFSGFSDLKYYIKTYNASQHEHITTEAFNDSVIALTKMTGNLVNYSNLQKSAEVILNAKTVYIAARGTSKSVAQHLNHLLLTIGLKCIILDDYNLLSIITPTIDPREVIILISLSGETRKIVEAAKIVKSRNVSIISITSFTHNVLARMSDINLYTASDSVATATNDGISRVGMFMIVEMLANEILYQKNPT